MAEPARPPRVCAGLPRWAWLVTAAVLSGAVGFAIASLTRGPAAQRQQTTAGASGDVVVDAGNG